ncbi:MAG: PEP-CTERM sorting domain-containing protein, partial [Planctomycetota bacterium]
DLVEYNLLTDTATLYLDDALFSGPPNIDAVYVNGSGNIILSTGGNATLGGLSFGKDDLIEYNPGTDTATLYFDGSLFSGNADIDAAHILSTNGNLVLSTAGNATLGGLSFGAGDLVEYNSGTDTATLYFDASNFSSAANIDAAFADTPEPATMILLGFGWLPLIFRRRRRS